MMTKTLTEVIVEEIMFKTKLIELTQREIVSLREELQAENAPKPVEPVAKAVEPATPSPTISNAQPEAGEPRKREHLVYSDIPGERWRAIPGYEGLYEVSDKGRVRSLPRMLKVRGGRERLSAVKLLKGHFTGSGNRQQMVGLTKNGHLAALNVRTLMREVWGM